MILDRDPSKNPRFDLLSGTLPAPTQSRGTPRMGAIMRRPTRFDEPGAPANGFRRRAGLSLHEPACTNPCFPSGSVKNEAVQMSRLAPVSHAGKRCGSIVWNVQHLRIRVDWMWASHSRPQKTRNEANHPTPESGSAIRIEERTQSQA
jgi:hypothetical protein